MVPCGFIKQPWFLPLILPSFFVLTSLLSPQWSPLLAILLSTSYFLYPTNLSLNKPPPTLISLHLSDFCGYCGLCTYI